jgi:hypothetical protein
MEAKKPLGIGEVKKHPSFESDHSTISPNSFGGTASVDISPLSKIMAPQASSSGTGNSANPQQQMGTNAAAKRKTVISPVGNKVQLSANFMDALLGGTEPSAPKKPKIVRKKLSADKLPPPLAPVTTTGKPAIVRFNP